MDRNWDGDIATGWYTICRVSLARVAWDTTDASALVAWSLLPIATTFSLVSFSLPISLVEVALEISVHPNTTDSIALVVQHRNSTSTRNEKYDGFWTTTPLRNKWIHGLRRESRAKATNPPSCSVPCLHALVVGIQECSTREGL